MGASIQERQAYTVGALRSMIGKALKADGCVKAEWLSSGRVRGWGNMTEGYDFVGDGVLTDDLVSTEIRHNLGSWHRGEGGPATTQEKLERYARVLRDAGFNVEDLIRDTDGYRRGLKVTTPRRKYA